MPQPAKLGDNMFYHPQVESCEPVLHRAYVVLCCTMLAALYIGLTQPV